MWRCHELQHSLQVVLLGAAAKLPVHAVHLTVAAGPPGETAVPVQGAQVLPPYPGRHWSHAAPVKPSLQTHAVLEGLAMVLPVHAAHLDVAAGPPGEALLAAHAEHSAPP